MNTKLRIRLYDKDEKLVSDRLVEQKLEFSVGPKEKHLGPMSLELNLRDKEDVVRAIDYINKLALDLPIEAKATAKRAKKVEDMLSSDKPVEDLKAAVLGKAKTQEELVELLRPYDFKFVHAQLLEDLNIEVPGRFELKNNHKDWQFMARLTKEAKNANNDKWDLRLVFGIKIVGDRFDKIQVYWWGKYEATKKLPWGDAKKINFKKKEKIMQFPAFMNYEERKRWRAEQRKVETQKDYKPSKFYDRWKPEIKLA